jgi:hypothetical protein
MGSKKKTKRLENCPPGVCDMMLYDITVTLQYIVAFVEARQNTLNPLIFRVGDTGLEPVTSAV